MLTLAVQWAWANVHALDCKLSVSRDDTEVKYWGGRPINALSFLLSFSGSMESMQVLRGAVRNQFMLLIKFRDQVSLGLVGR